VKAAYYERPGSAADVLVIGNLPDPEPSFGEVRVKVVFSGLNPTDIETRTGFAGRPMPFPRIVPHQDGAGIIDKVGVGVSESRIGDRVWLYKAQTGQPFGSAAEYVYPSVGSRRPAGRKCFIRNRSFARDRGDNCPSLTVR
jgi:NADPH:quinone reductase